MKKHSLFSLILMLFAFSLVAVRTAAAQTETPPADATPVGPVGQVTGSVTYKKNGEAVTESMEVMLHILDENLQDKGMTHGNSKPDGTFAFADVPFDSRAQFAVMATYDGVPYYSEVEPADMESLKVSLDVPVYETTSELADVQVDQMHVIFGLAEDGLETQEIYIFSNAGERTVKDVYELQDNKSATLEFPLPKDADFIFFQPDEQERFVKFEGGFADTYPLAAGAQQSQLMVSYLVPYSGKRIYTYTAPLSIRAINLLVPEQAGLSLQGSRLVEAEPIALQNGETYQVYTLSQLKAGETVSLTLSGRGRAAIPAISANSKTTLAAGLFMLGAAVLGSGLWWWKRSGRSGGWQDGSEAETRTDEIPTDFDETINEIARLDQSHENGDVDEEEYRRSREELRKRAKALLDQDERKR